MLAKIYADNIDVTQYWVSEKLDGVRAHWDGKQLISRGGKVFEVCSRVLRFLMLIFNFFLFFFFSIKQNPAEFFFSRHINLCAKF